MQGVQNSSDEVGEHDFQMHGITNALVGTLFEKASTRWLNPHEVLQLLIPETTPLSVATEPPPAQPHSGSMFLYDKSQANPINYKDDKYEWVRKKGSDEIREDSKKLKMDGVYMFSVCYVNSATFPTLHRRTYNLLHDRKGRDDGTPVANKNMVLVHYLDTYRAAKFSAKLAENLILKACNQKSDESAKKESAKNAFMEKTLGEATDFAEISKHAEKEKNTFKWSDSRTHAKSKSNNPYLTSTTSGTDFSEMRHSQKCDEDEDDEADLSQEEEMGGNEDDTDYGEICEEDGYNFSQAEIVFDDIAEDVEDLINEEIEGMGDTPMTDPSLKHELSHQNTPSGDGGAMDVLWSMVMEDDKEEVPQQMADVGLNAITEAAAQAIEKHMTPNMENELVDTLEQVIVDHAVRSPSSQERAVTLEEKVLKTLEQSLHPALEEKLFHTVEKNLAEGSKETVVHIAAPTLPEVEGLGATRDERVEAIAKEQGTGKIADNILSYMNDPQKKTQQPTPLTHLVDFTPEKLLLPGSCDEAKEIKLVISLASPIEELPPSSDPNSVWVLYAAFSDIITNVSTLPDLPSDVLIRNCSISTPLKKITPYSYKCSANYPIKQAGDRHIILVAVELPKAAKPNHRILEKAMVVALQAAFNSALDTRGLPYLKTFDCVNKNNHPTFYFPANIGSKICLLSQNSLTTLNFFSARENRLKDSCNKIVLKADDEKNTDVRSNESLVSSEPGKSKVLPAPAPMIATVANAMMSYPLVVPDSAVEIAPARGKKRTMGTEAATEENSDDALAWISQNPPENRDETIGDSVNRHCKIRFVERMANVIVKTENSDSNYMAPQKDDEKVTINTVKTVPEPIALVPLGEAYGIDDTTLEQVGGLEIFNEQGITNLDDEQLETLLDSFLIRMIQSVIDSSTDEESLRAELNSQDKSGFALLHYAALYNLQSLVPILFKKGANPNVQTLNNNLTPLHLAAGAGNFAVIKALVTNGATVNTKDSRGLTPRCHARQNKFPEVAAWLRQQKTDDDDLISSDGSVHTIKTEGSDDVGRILMQAAFKNLNLKEKITLCLLSGKMEEEPVVQRNMEQKSPPRALLAGTKTKQKTQQGKNADFDIGHFMTPKDKKSIDVAMSLMSEGELQELTSSTAQHNARTWLVKNSYESMQLVPEKKKGSLNQTKLSQVLASLVIRKQFLAKQARKREECKTP